MYFGEVTPVTRLQSVFYIEIKKKKMYECVNRNLYIFFLRIRKVGVTYVTNGENRLESSKINELRGYTSTVT